MDVVVERVERRTLGDRLASFGRNAISLIQKHFILFGACVLAIFVLARLDDWLFRNEVFTWMSEGVPYKVGHPSLDVFAEAAAANCKSLSGPALETCRDYQNTLKGSAVDLHPIHSFFGKMLASEYGDAPWLNQLHTAAVWSSLLGGLLMIGLWVLFIRCLPLPGRTLVAALSLLLLLMGHYRDEPSLIFPDPLDDGVQIWESIVLPLIVVLFLLGWRLVQNHPILSGRYLVQKFSLRRKRVIQIFLIALVLDFALPPVGAIVPEIIAFVGLLIVAWWLSSLEGVSPWIAGCILVFLFIMVSGDNNFILRKLEVSKHQLSLVVGIYIVYMTAKPRGPLGWLLPTFAIFHVPGMAVLGLALFLSELPICVRRLRLSPLLGISAVTFAATYWFTQQSQIQLGNPANVNIREVVSMCLANPRFWPTIVVLTVIVCVSLWPLFRRGETWDGLARCGFLALECIGATFVAIAILDAEPGLQISPGYYSLVQVHKFLGPALSYGIVLSLSFLLFQMITTEKRWAESDASSPFQDWRLAAPVLGIVVLMGLAKIDFAPRLLVLDALHNVVKYVFLNEPHNKWCTYLSQGAGFDDHYIISSDDPTSGVENAFSALKLKIRISEGVHTPDKMHISISVPQGNGCK